MGHKCVVCGCTITEYDYDGFGAIHARNPITFRAAWMHYECMGVALADQRSVPSSNPQYASRYDEYMSRFDEGVR